MATASLVATQLPRVYGKPPPIIPKLNYAPTIDQLISDFSTQQQMLSVDLIPPSGAPGTGLGKAGIAFDDSNMNFILAHTTMTQLQSEDAYIAVDGKPTGTTANEGGSVTTFTPPDTDDYYAVFKWNASSNGKTSQFFKGTGSGWSTPTAPPLGFIWDARFTKSYFNPSQDHVVFAAQIPNSSMGAGSGGNYGMYLGVGPADGSDGPQYPSGAALVVPNSYGVFTTAYPVPEITSPPLLAAGVLALPALLMSWRKRRLDAKK